MFIAMNNFKVAPGKGDEFETQWRNREIYLEQVPGFVQFSLLKGDGEDEYISHTVWESRDAFVKWTQSDAFAAGHRQGSVGGLLLGPPQVKLYEAVLVQKKGEPAQT
jgi:heme-degrading monooxygenase HmoA